MMSLVERKSRQIFANFTTQEFNSRRKGRFAQLLENNSEFTLDEPHHMRTNKNCRGYIGRL